MILTDYHVHSSISPDASSSMKEMCESAIQKGSGGNRIHRPL